MHKPNDEFLSDEPKILTPRTASPALVEKIKCSNKNQIKRYVGCRRRPLNVQTAQQKIVLQLFFNGTNMCHLRSIAEKPNELRLIDAARPGKVF